MPEFMPKHKTKYQMNLVTYIVLERNKTEEGLSKKNIS